MANKQTNSKAERTRQFIIEKASVIFNKKGYAGTSLTDLLNATKLTKGSLYGNFENKDEIAAAAFEYNFNWLKMNLVTTSSSKTNSIDKLLAIVDFYRKRHVELFNRGGCPILNTATEADDNMPLLSKKVNESLQQWKKLIESIIVSGIKQKEIKQQVDPSTYAILLIAMIEGGIMIAQALHSNKNLAIVLDKVDKMILEELKK
jgi:TetR/AcrR family transcriptional regulator, transcriptional repressor for nem operon